MPSKRDLLIDALTRFIIDSAVEKGMRLMARDPLAVEWASVRGLSGVFGYPTFEEARADVVRTLERTE